MNITVCLGSACHLRGSRSVATRLQELIAEHQVGNQIELSGSMCMEHCAQGVCVTVDNTHFTVSPDTVDSFFKKQVLSRLSAT